jgi:hypothetical protein
LRGATPGSTPNGASRELCFTSIIASRPVSLSLSSRREKTGKQLHTQQGIACSASSASMYTSTHILFAFVSVYGTVLMQKPELKTPVILILAIKDTGYAGTYSSSLTDALRSDQPYYTVSPLRN